MVIDSVQKKWTLSELYIYVSFELLEQNALEDSSDMYP